MRPAASRLRCIKFNIPSRISGGSLRWATGGRPPQLFSCLSSTGKKT
jgi:hypothetical protein